MIGQIEWLEGGEADNVEEKVGWWEDRPAQWRAKM